MCSWKSSLALGLRVVRLPVILLAGVAVLSGCLATAVNNIGLNLSDKFSAKINFLVPAKSADSAALKSVLIVTDNTEVARQIAAGFESSLNKLRINERPYYSTVKQGPRFDGRPSDAQLTAVGRSSGVDAVIVLTGGAANVRTESRTEDRYSCAVETKLFESCPKGRERNTKVNCTTTVGAASAHLRVFRVVDRQSVYVDSVAGVYQVPRCDDQNTPRPESGQVAYAATLSAMQEGLHIVAPSYQLRPLDLMAADAGVPDAQRKDFDAAGEFARAKRMDEACQRFDTLYLDYKESPALTFNVAFCSEVRGDLLRANQGYKRASELVNAPQAQIDRRLTATETALRESPAGQFMPTLSNTNTAATTPSTGGLMGDKRIALVIGNARYQRGALINPVNDARLVGDRLKRVGFDVTILENLESARFEAAARDFAFRAKGADVALFYYAGHAVQSEGENYLMPVDNAKMRTMKDVRDGGSVQLASIVAQLEVAAPVIKLVVIDACRDNPLPESANLKRGLGGGGLAAIRKPPQGGLIAFATSPGQAAEDGTGKNSVYSKYFAEQLSVPNQSIEQLFKRVRESVKNETKNGQIPMEVSSLTVDVFMVKAK